MSNITQDVVKELFSYKDGKLYWKGSKGSAKKGRIAGRINSTGYKQIGVNNNLYSTHRLVWLWHRGSWPENQIDHIDGNRLNNRIENLRDVSHAENQRNLRMSPKNKSGYTGVQWDKRASKWRVRVVHENKKIDLGHFAEKGDAGSMAFAARHQLGFHENHGNEAVGLSRGMM